MLKTYALMAFTLMSLLAPDAQAFITVLNVTQIGGAVLSVDSADDISFHQLDGRAISYSGLANEAINLFQAIAEESLPHGITSYEYEVNEATGTITAIIAVNGFVGPDYDYYVIRKASR